MHHQSPITNHQSPITNHQSLTAKIFAALLALPAGSLAESVTLDIVEGDIVISETGYSHGGADETSYTGDYVIVQSCLSDDENSYCNDEDGKSTEYTITVSSGSHNITLQDVGITGEESPAFTIKAGASVYLTLEGGNTLDGDDKYAGLNVPSGASLEIAGEGYLRAISDGAAGIGGNFGETAGNITISGGAVIAESWGDAYEAGAGIGGGPNGDGGTVSITGGLVFAASWVEGSYLGAGIGGGYKGSGGTITITGGTIYASTGGDTDLTGAGIGGGENGNGGTISITGGTVVADRIGGGENGDGESIEISGGIVIVEDAIGKGENGSSDGNITISEDALFVLAPSSTTIKLSDYASSKTFPLSSDASWPKGYRLYIDTAYTFKLAEGFALTNYDTIFVHGDLSASGIVNHGNVTVYGDLSADDFSNANTSTDTSAYQFYDLTDLGNLKDGTLDIYGTLSANDLLNENLIYAYGTLSASTLVNEDTIYVYGALSYEELENNGVIINKTWLDGTMSLWESDTITFDTAEISLRTVVQTEDFTLDSGCVFVVEAGQTLNINATFTISEGATFINNGGSVIISGTLVIEGTYEGTYTLAKTGSVTIGSDSDESPIAAGAKALGSSKISASELGIMVRTTSAVRASIYNLKGELVQAKTLSAGETQISGLDAGVYLVKLSDGTKGMVKVR